MKVKYFEWGNEKPGYVTAWRRGYEFECPFA